MPPLPPKVAWPLAVIITALVAAGGLVIAKPDVEQTPPIVTPPTVRTRPAVPEPVRLTVRTHGTVVPRTESELVAEVSGRILWVSPSLASGGFIEEGEPLLRIDPVDYEIGLARARASLKRAHSERTLSVTALDRYRRLASRGVESASALEAAQNGREVAEAAVIEAEASLAQANRDLARTEVRSPFLGRVRDKRVDVGHFVARGAPIARVYAVDYAEVRLPVSVADAAFVDLPIAYRGDSDDTDGDAAGQQDTADVILRAPFGGRIHTWSARIVRTEGELDPQTRMIHAVARVDDPYGRGETPDRPPLSVGLFVEAEILGRHMDDVIRVPRSAVRGNDRVAVVDVEDRLRMRTVEILKRNRNDVLVTAGLEPGDRLCTTPLSIAVDGMQVAVFEESAPSTDSLLQEPTAEPHSEIARADSGTAQ